MQALSTLSKASTAIDIILTALECISDERFWQRVFGQRILELGKRYFGNDFVLLSMGFYIASILRTRVGDLMTHLWQKGQLQKNLVEVQVDTYDTLYKAIDYFVRKNAKAIPDLRRTIASYSPDDVYPPVSGNGGQERLPTLIFTPPAEVVEEVEYKGHRIWASRAADDENNNRNTPSTSFGGGYGGQGPRKLTIYMEGNSLSTLQQFMQEWADIYNRRHSNQMTIYKANAWNWYAHKTMEPRQLQTVVLKEGLKEKLIQDMDTFRRRKNWYKTRAVPYKREYLLHGPPGTGKSSLIQAIAGHVGVNICLVNIQEILDDEAFAKLLENSPTNSIIVLEDIDHYGNGLGNKNLSLAGLLNAFDGIQGQTGSMIFMTCNNIDMIPPPLLRPGRIDVKILMDYADTQQIEEMFFKFFYDPENVSAQTSDKEYINTLKWRFASKIPEGKVTTAELESYFIFIWMESDPQNLEDGIFDRVFQGIPEFLKTVQFDRRQAMRHYGKDKTYNNSKTKVATAAGATEESKEAELDAISDASTVNGDGSLDPSSGQIVKKIAVACT